MKNLQDFIPKKILVLQQRQLGDVIVSTPVFTALRKKYPNAHIALFTEEKCYPLVSKDPHIDSFEILNKSNSQSFFQKFFSPWKTYWNIRKEKYDIIIDLQQLPRCQLVTFLSTAKYKISYTPRHMYKNLLYTHCQIPENLHDYISYGKTSILSPLGITPSYEKPMLYLTEAEKNHGRKILNSINIQANTPFLTIDATHKHKHRRWKYFDKLIQKILDHYPDYKILLLRAPGEEEQLQKLIEINPNRVCMPTIPPNLRESMACMYYANFHIGNTSAPAHMALALNIPALIILSHTAKLWHFDPQSPLKGMPKQIEVRVDPQKLALYYKQQVSHSKKEKPSSDAHTINKIQNFKILPHPELDLIDEDQAFKAFENLYHQPFYE